MAGLDEREKAQDARREVLLGLSAVGLLALAESYVREVTLERVLLFTSLCVGGDVGGQG